MNLSFQFPWENVRVTIKMRWLRHRLIILHLGVNFVRLDASADHGFILPLFHLAIFPVPITGLFAALLLFIIELGHFGFWEMNDEIKSLVGF